MNSRSETTTHRNSTTEKEIIPTDKSVEESIIETTIVKDLPTKKEEALADRFMKKGIDKMSENIGISEKFLFIHELFKGDTERYIKELNNLDSSKDAETAHKSLNKLSEELTWNEEAHAFLELKKLVERKYPI